MFDYQAGEKFKLTLIMAGLAGLMAGMFFTMLLMPSPGPAQRHKAVARYMNNPDITGGRPGATYDSAQRAAGAMAGQPGSAQAATPVVVTDSKAALDLVQSWLPKVWDLSAGTAKASQDTAMAYMTADCASAYKQNIWTADLAKQIEESGLQSVFNAKAIRASDNNPDGSVVIYVEGDQVLQVPGKPARARPVRLEYLVKQTADGLRIAGISEGGSHS